MMMVVVILMMSEISLEIWMFEDIIIYIDDHNIDGDNTGAWDIYESSIRTLFEPDNLCYSSSSSVNQFTSLIIPIEKN